MRRFPQKPVGGFGALGREGREIGLLCIGKKKSGKNILTSVDNANESAIKKEKGKKMEKNPDMSPNFKKGDNRSTGY